MTAAPAAVLPSVPPQTPGEALGLLAARRATGALRGPLGSLYLVDGRVAHADSPRAPGLADLLTGCGRITPEDWAELLRVHGPRARVAEALVERRLLTRGELELGHLGTLFDAAFFVLADRAGGLWRFEPEARHWLGPVRAVDAERLRREVGRRGRLLERIWPWPQLDTAPVRPAAPSAPPSHRTAGRRRRELLDHADGRRTPADLARLLGRSGFGVTADIRRLAAAGLLDAPRHAAPGTAERRAAEVPSAAPPAEPPEVPSAASPAVPPAAAPEAPAPVRPAGGLHRRVPGATLPGATRTGPAAPGSTAPGPAAPARSDRPPAAAAHPLAVPDPDIALLTRVRTLLEARL
ncbi:transcriptional regulator [Kitasatospora sp. NPDC087314]|uniref:transcriptional regulator n=1 Tax=Kitasatospora sp. NPDC087314 TaxID=3364068 RepID=UPI00381376D5